MCQMTEAEKEKALPFYLPRSDIQISLIQSIIIDL
jgi:hypothetical protein